MVIRSRLGARRFVLATLLAALVVALSGLLAGPAFSASPSLHARTRAAALEQAAGRFVVLDEDTLPGGSRPRVPNYDRFATGSSVATETDTTTSAGLTPTYSYDTLGRISTFTPHPGTGFQLRLRPVAQAVEARDRSMVG